MRDGNHVERLARDLFPDGYLITSRNPARADLETRAAMAAGHTVIFQATVLAETGTMAKADVLVRTIQQYEQRQKDINKAQAETLLRLARTLNCNVEDLMEKVPFPRN